MRKIKSCKDMYGNKLIIGDRVEICNIYTNEFNNEICEIIDMWHQGRDGVILKFDSPPMP